MTDLLRTVDVKCIDSNGHGVAGSAGAVEVRAEYIKAGARGRAR